MTNNRRRSSGLSAARILLLGTASVLVFASAAAAQTTTAPVQTAPPAGSAPATGATGEATSVPTATDTTASANQVTVTGTRIRGVAPVGSALVSVTKQDIKESGLTSTADIISDIPSILTLGTGNAWSGGNPQGGDTLNSLAYGKSPNMRGLGPQATLSLVNGHRMAYEGANMNEFDGDNYPSQILSRVEVVQDGASALYGADAIAGTVNYILRSPTDTAEAYGGYGWANGQDTWFATGVIGYTWNDDNPANRGGFIASYQHTYQSALAASADPKLYDDNFAPYGGASSPIFSAPGNVQVGNTLYAIPGGQNGSALTLSQLGQNGVPNTTSAWAGGVDAIPEETADRFALNFNQNLTDWLQIFGDALYVSRTVALNWTNSGATNFVSAAVPNSNPFSPCNPSHYSGGTVVGPAALVAACATGSLNVLYSDVFDVGPSVKTVDPITTWSFTGGAKFSLPHDWTATAEASDSYHTEHATESDFSSGQPNAATFNYFCAPNGATPCNSAATDAAINATGASLISTTTYEDQDYMLNADGPLFALPGGDVRLALGVEYYNAVFINLNSFGEDAHDPRNITSGYGELYVPIVGAANSMPGIYKLDLDVSGRIDSYSDVGRTENPKIGINWYPTEDLKIHASWGTGFRAPGLADNDPTTQHGYLEAAVPGTSLSPSICTTASGCQGVGNGIIYQVIGGAAGTLKPETSQSYSVGGDWNPKSVPGLSASINYWWVNYAGQINFPCYNAGAVGCVDQQLYNSQIIYNPQYFPALAANNPVAFFGPFPVNKSIPSCAAIYGQKVTTQAQYNNLASCINSGGDGAVFGPPAGSNLLAIEDSHRINAGITTGDGLDLTASYTRMTGWGTWKVAGVAEYVNSWKVATITGAPAVQEANRFGYPVTFKMRDEVSWNNDFSFGNLAASVFVNYTNAYKMDLDLLPVGVSPSYANIGSYTTVDLTLGYDSKSILSSPLARDLTIALSIQNLFGAQPPLVLNSAGGAGGGLMFDPANASPLGRVIQIQVGKKF